MFHSSKNGGLLLVVRVPFKLVPEKKFLCFLNVITKTHNS